MIDSRLVLVAFTWVFSAIAIISYAAENDKCRINNGQRQFFNNYDHSYKNCPPRTMASHCKDIGLKESQNCMDCCFSDDAPPKKLITTIKPSMPTTGTYSALNKPATTKDIILKSDPPLKKLITTTKSSMPTTATAPSKDVPAEDNIPVEDPSNRAHASEGRIPTWGIIVIVIGFAFLIAALGTCICTIVWKSHKNSYRCNCSALFRTEDDNISLESCGALSNTRHVRS